MQAADLVGDLPGIIEQQKVPDGRLVVIVPEGVDVGMPHMTGPEALDAEVAVPTVTEAEGLEFDAVVVVEPAAILAESPRGARRRLRGPDQGDPAPLRRPYRSVAEVLASSPIAALALTCPTCENLVFPLLGAG